MLSYIVFKIANYYQGPDVSRFIASLNTVSSVQGLAGYDQDNFDLDKEQLINTQFFNFDPGQDTDLQPITFNFNTLSRVVSVLATENTDSIKFITGIIYKLF